jgi:DNA-binding transcriptional MerR regulator
MPRDSERYTIGQFSKLTRLTPKALRLYGELGLLRPADVDPSTGYRFYAFAQARRAAAMSLLRSVELPLADIARIVEATTSDEVRLLLSAHRATLEGRLEEHRRMLLEVEQLIQRGEIMEILAKLDELEPETIATVPFASTMDDVGAAVGEAYAQLFGALAGAGVTPAGPPQLHHLRPNGDVWSMYAAVAIPPDTTPPEQLETEVRLLVHS